MPKHQYVYLVSYAHRHGFGMIEISSNQPVDTYAAVDAFRDTIASQADSARPISSADVTVISFQLLNDRGW